MISIFLHSCLLASSEITPSTGLVVLGLTQLLTMVAAAMTIIKVTRGGPYVTREDFIIAEKRHTSDLRRLEDSFHSFQKADDDRFERLSASVRTSISDLGKDISKITGYIEGQRLARAAASTPPTPKHDG